MMKTPSISLLLVCCIFLVHYPPHYAQAVNDNGLIKKLCFVNAPKPFTVRAKNGQKFLFEFEIQHEEEEKKWKKHCAKISTEKWKELEDSDIITLENKNGHPLGNVSVQFLRVADENVQASNADLRKMYFNTLSSKFYARTGHIVVLEFEIQQEANQTLKQCAKISTGKWTGLNDSDTITFENGGENPLGKVSVQLLREVGANATELEFPYGILRCYIRNPGSGVVKISDFRTHP
ncbi:hypothetical protein niasHT_017668 [Heterodera trifolii]|uniref:Uncharacterized protein n=1 Tax=Heterodera trifolii TaxID=157864 RepID=A0ABD2L8E0_9BILA